VVGSARNGVESRRKIGFAERTNERHDFPTDLVISFERTISLPCVIYRDRTTRACVRACSSAVVDIQTNAGLTATITRANGSDEDDGHRGRTCPRSRNGPRNNRKTVL